MHISSKISAGFLAWIGIAPCAAVATPVSHEGFINLAAQCAPTVSPTILEAVARTESGLDPWALHDNTSGQEYRPTGLSDATATAQKWIARGDSVDVGIMQINSANLAALDLSVTTALDPCASLAGGAAILRAAYGGGATPAAQQVALLMALSRYNTGSPFKGIMNGYARTVLENGKGTITRDLPSVNQLPPHANPEEPPAWNVSATGAYVLDHGAPWLVALVPLQTSSITYSTSQAR